MVKHLVTNKNLVKYNVTYSLNLLMFPFVANKAVVIIYYIYKIRPAPLHLLYVTKSYPTCDYGFLELWWCQWTYFRVKKNRKL